jgi:tripartite-type tricarboxylate transporter receptor subunit TctC
MFDPAHCPKHAMQEEQTMNIRRATLAQSDGSRWRSSAAPRSRKAPQFSRSADRLSCRIRPAGPPTRWLGCSRAICRPGSDNRSWSTTGRVLPGRSTEAVARAAPDGYTLLLHTSVIATDPTFKKTLPYDVKRDLAPVTLAVNGPYLLVVNPTLPVKNVAELIAYAKANPGKLNFGSAGQGSSGHLIGELFKTSAGIDMVHVPYKGGGPSITGLMGNEVQLLFDTISGSGALAESGKLRALAVTSSARSPALPNVPTINESGLKDFSVVYWLGIFAPAKTPPEIVDKLYKAFRASLDNPEVSAKLAATGQVVQGLPPAEFAKVLDSDIVRWRTVIESAKIVIE